MSFLNRCAVRANAGGSGDFVLVNAIPGFYTPPLCLNPSVVDGAEYNYFAVSDDGTQHEEGIGVWNAALNTLYRGAHTPRNSSNSGGYVTFSAAPIVYMGGPTAEDMLTIYEDHDTEQFGIGVGAGGLQSGRVTIAPTASGFGDDLVTNGSFAGNADNWTLGSGWAYDTNKITFTPDGGFGEATQTVSGIKNGTTYQVTVVVSGYVAGDLGAQVGGGTGSLAVSGDGTYTVEITSLGGSDLAVFANTEDFAGSVTSVTLKEKLAITAITFLHEDGSVALIVNTSASGSGDAPTFSVGTNNRPAFNSTHLIHRKTDGSFGVDLSAQGLTANRNILWPNKAGTIALVDSVLAVDQLPTDGVQLRAVVYDASLDIAAGLGTVVVGGGSNCVPVYLDVNTGEWKIG